MKKFLSSFFLLSIHLIVHASDIDVANLLAKRIVPAFSGRIIFSVLPATGKDEFELKWNNDKLTIGGNNANSMAVGLNYYLKYFCHTSVSWYSSDRIFIPAKMPEVMQPVKHDARCASRFMLNYCTFGY